MPCQLNVCDLSLELGILVDFTMNIQSQLHGGESGGFETSNGRHIEDAGLAKECSGTHRGSTKPCLVEWLNSVLPDVILPPGASLQELRDFLLDGTVLCVILNKLYPGSIEMGGSSESGSEKVKKFLAAINEIGLPSFQLLDLEQGSMVPVLQCLGALQTSFDYDVGDKKDEIHRSNGSDLSRVGSAEGIIRPQGDMLTCWQHPISAPQLNQLADLSGAKTLELIKSNGFDNVSTQSLFHAVNRILDDSIKRKNGDVDHLVAYVVRKFIQVIEQRVMKQAENFKNHNNLYMAREEKYQTIVRALETLAMGTSEENEVFLNQLQCLKIEKMKIEERKIFDEQDVERLKREKDCSDSQISTLRQEIEFTKSTYESRCRLFEKHAKDAKLEMERKIKELECHLVDSRKKMREIEIFSESKFQGWKKKECAYQNFVNCQSGALHELKAALESSKHEILKTKGFYAKEFNYLGVRLKELADVAENYHAVLAENRRLYNEVQDLKGNIRVYCRIRPFLQGQSKKQTSIEYIGENGELIISNPCKQGSRRLFKFNKVFGPTTTQEQVFLDTQPLIRSVLDGYNVCIFAYGQTGSGKTYTMSGPSMSSTVDWGVNFRALNDLFQISQSRRGSITYDVGVQMVEIYNEQVRDLLSNESSQKRLGICNTTQPNGLAVPDASMHPVNSTTDVLEFMNIGLTNRAVGATALNERSSRSHSILTVHVRGMDLKTDTVLRGSLHLVDLAGSERVDKSQATGDRLREAQNINKSLSSLGDVIFALAQKSPHVPYRNSKLTQVLQSSLGGQAKTLMFVQMNPDVESYSETISTLKFAERVSGVELGAARSNKEGRDVRELMEQVASLKDTIAKKDEDLEQFQKANFNVTKRGMNLLRYGSCSPRRHSVGIPHHRQSGLKGLGKTEREASDMDNGSEYSSDKHSEAGSQLSVDEFQHQKEFSPHSKVGGDSSQNLTEDFELLGFGGDSEERLSDISDGGLSMGTETEGSMASVVEYTLFPEVAKSVETINAENAQAGDIQANNSQAGDIQAEKAQAQSIQTKKTQSKGTQAHNVPAENTRKTQSEISENRNVLPSKLPKPSQKLVPTKSSRLSLSRSSSKVLSSAKKATPSRSSLAKSLKR